MIAIPFLPPIVPTHWGVSGHPDAFGSPWPMLVLMPATVLGLLATSYHLASRIQDPDGGFFGTMAITSGFFVAIHGVVLAATGSIGFSPVRPLVALVFGLLAALAPLMARVEPNPWCGVRTPWTLGSRRVWKATHRATARLWLIGGVVGSALTLFGAPLLVVILLLVVLGMLPIYVSYRVWTKLGRP